MGVPNFLPSLLEPHSVGRPFDIRDFYDPSEENDRTENGGVDADSTTTNDTTTASSHTPKKLRVAIDVSTWVYKACQGFGDVLADDRFLDNFGRRQLEQEQQQQDQHQNQDQNQATTTTRPRHHTPSTEQIQLFTQKCVAYVTSRLTQWQAYADILVVLDGRSPPSKVETVAGRRHHRQSAQAARDAPDTAVEQRFVANKRAGAGTEYPHVIDALIVHLRSHQIPLLVAPYEADGQLAYLSEQGLIDLVITEDSDLLPCGATAVLYKVLDKQWPTYYPAHHHAMATTRHTKKQKIATTTPHEQANPSQQQQPQSTLSSSSSSSSNNYFSIYQGLLIRQQDWGACRTHDLQDISPALLALVFCLAGCDYCTSLPGIGIGKALGIVRQVYWATTASSSSSKSTTTKSTAQPLRQVLDQVYQASWKKKDSQPLTPAFCKSYEEQLLAALVSFRHGVVYDPLSGKCIYRNLSTPDPEFISYPPYQRIILAKDSATTSTQLSAIVGTLIPAPTCHYIAEGWLEARTERPRTAGKGQPYLALPRKIQDFVNQRKRQQKEGATENEPTTTATTGDTQENPDPNEPIVLEDDDNDEMNVSIEDEPQSFLESQDIEPMQMLHEHSNDRQPTTPGTATTPRTPHSSSQSTTGLASQLPSSLSQSTGASSQPLLSGYSSSLTPPLTRGALQQQSPENEDDDDEDLLESQLLETQDPMN